MIIAVASGKGGTGKTTVAVNMALSVHPSLLLDCDVEEPNAHLLLNGKVLKTEHVHILIPEIDEKLCSKCGKCADFCHYNAIFIGQGHPLVFQELCHSCGGCALICRSHAINERETKVGVLNFFDSDPQVIHGELDIGIPRAIPVIKAVKENINVNQTTIIDVPAGVSCPAVEAVNGSDFCLLVTEPTPFGLHDLNLMVQVLQRRHIPLGIVINKATKNRCIHEYSEKQGIPILLEIPLDQQIAELYARGIPFSLRSKTWQHRFRMLTKEIKELVQE